MLKRVGWGLSLVAFAAIPLVGCEESIDGDVADTVLVNGKVVTVDAALPEAEAVAIKGYTILAVGTSDEISELIGPETEIVDLEGQLAIPGFVEAHGHWMSLGQSKLVLDLTQARSWDEIVAMVGDAVAETEPGEWILGRGWHQEKWDQVPVPNVDGVPINTSLTAASPDNPVNLTHASGHASFANAMALELGGIDASTADPAGGTIVKDASGRPTGLLRETAQRLVGRAIAHSREGLSAEEVELEAREAVRLAGEDALSKGVTSFHDAGSDFATIDFFKKLEEEGGLPLRLYVMVRRESNEDMAEKLPQYKMLPEGNDFLTVRSIKRQVDGALGAHGAWLLEPYEDHESTGLVLEPLEDIMGTARVAIQHGFQVNTHAIGDRGNQEILDLYQEAFEEASVLGEDLRWRIEHAQHLRPEDVGRFVELGVIPSMQGIHCTSDAPWVYQRLGAERAESGAYLWRDLIDSGAVVNNGTDTPVEDVDPIPSFYASVTRIMPNGEVFFPEQAMTREEALRSYTINGAYSAFEEDVKGSLTPGKYADIVVLSKDIMTVPAEEIPTAEVVYTIVGGEIRYRRGN
ncbi:MAG: amidohydrolase [Gemmatimonadetes bacterium]|nr:amidohydrolase [Gemmatimonadota bacterium]NNM05703.1 amidohydrolase [Gemmatimonadota bacterium]